MFEPGKRLRAGVRQTQIAHLYNRDVAVPGDADSADLYRLLQQTRDGALHFMAVILKVECDVQPHAAQHDNRNCGCCQQR